MRHYVIVLDFGYADDPNVRSTVHDLAATVIAHRLHLPLKLAHQL